MWYNVKFGYMYMFKCICLNWVKLIYILISLW